MFHKITTERDLALKEGDDAKAQSCQKELEEMGGRPEYQRASQLSTSFHSTSKWVLGHLANNGWLFGIKTDDSTNEAENCNNSSDVKTAKRGRKRTPRRTTRILEVGAINTELLDAAGIVASSSRKDKKSDQDAKPSSPPPSQSQEKKIHVRAIDIHSMEERIEEADFLELPIVSPNDPSKRYDVIVCSMVLNCVTTPIDRGKMLALLYHQLRPGGLCFFTIPKFCVTKSAFLTHSIFKKMLGKNGVGFNIQATKESPRLAFFILERPIESKEAPTRRVDPAFRKEIIRNKGKKFPNQFSVVLKPEHIFRTKG